MRTANTVAQMLVRICGLVQIVLGVLFWTGNAGQLIPVHILVGLLLVISLWVVAGIGLRTGVPVGLGILAIAWGVIVPILGLTQDSLAPGGAHVLIQVLHLAIGLIAIGLAETIGRRTRQLLGGAPDMASA